jgi:isocitrate dehydrogenase (NAD+)
MFAYSLVVEMCFVIAGDGIGPEIAEAVKRIFACAEVPIKWDHQYVGLNVDERTRSMVSRENLDSVLV